MNMKSLKSNRTHRSSNKKKEEDDYFLQDLVETNYRNRFWITVVTIATFLLLIAGIMYSMYYNTPISKDWKEILMLLLGAFIGSYQKIMQFWFDTTELIKEMVKWAEREDDPDKNPNNKKDENDSKQLLND